MHKSLKTRRIAAYLIFYDKWSDVHSTVFSQILSAPFSVPIRSCLSPRRHRSWRALTANPSLHRRLQFSLPRLAKSRCHPFSLPRADLPPGSIRPLWSFSAFWLLNRASTVRRNLIFLAHHGLSQSLANSPTLWTRPWKATWSNGNQALSVLSAFSICTFIFYFSDYAMLELTWCFLSFIVIVSKNEYSLKIFNSPAVAEPCLVHSAKQVIMPDNWSVLLSIKLCVVLLNMYNFQGVP